MKKLLSLISAVAIILTPTVSADSLVDIYEQAKKNDPVLLQAQAQRESAFSAIAASRSVLLPQINLTAGYNTTATGDVTQDSQASNVGIGFSQSLFNRAGWVALSTSEKVARQADATYAAVQQSLITRVASAYFSVLRAQDNLVFVQSEKAAVARQLEQTTQRFEVGLSAITDVHDAQAQYDAVLAEEILSQNELTNTYELLREITGQAHTNLYVLDTERFSATPSKETSDALVEAATQTNLSLLASRIAQDISRDQISLASSARLPTLSLTGGYSQYEELNEDITSPGPYTGEAVDTLNLGVNLEMPLFTGGNITSLTKQAKFQHVSASQQLEATYREVVRNVRGFNNNINASIGALKAYEQGVISSQSALKATEAGFEVGTRTIVDVLDSTRRLYDSNRSLSDARYNYILSVLQLDQAVGTLSEQEILDINAGLKDANAKSAAKKQRPTTNRNPNSQAEPAEKTSSANTEREARAESRAAEREARAKSRAAAREARANSSSESEEETSTDDDEDEEK